MYYDSVTLYDYLFVIAFPSTDHTSIKHQPSFSVLMIISAVRGVGVGIRAGVAGTGWGTCVCFKLIKILI
jgi:hypothetical protein